MPLGPVRAAERCDRRSASQRRAVQLVGPLPATRTDALLDTHADSPIRSSLTRDARRNAAMRSLDLTRRSATWWRFPASTRWAATVSGPEYFEYRVTDYLEALFQRLESALSAADGRAEARQHRGPARRRSAAAAKAGQLVLFEAHQDTVPVDGHDDRAVDAGGARRPAVWPRRVRHQGGHDGHARRRGAAGRRAAARHAHDRHGLHGQRRAWLQRRHGADASSGRSPARSFRGSPTWP